MIRKHMADKVQLMEPPNRVNQVGVKEGPQHQYQMYPQQQVVNQEDQEQE
jgi:hypothetical protein